jgi:lauroyl/myristoyl acyltransferase
VYHGEDGGWDVFIGAALTVERTDSLRNDVTALTRRLAASFERGIAGKPTDWHMFQDYWPA